MLGSGRCIKVITWNILSEVSQAPNFRTYFSHSEILVLLSGAWHLLFLTYKYVMEITTQIKHFLIEIAYSYRLKHIKNLAQVFLILDFVN